MKRKLISVAALSLASVMMLASCGNSGNKNTEQGKTSDSASGTPSSQAKETQTSSGTEASSGTESTGTKREYKPFDTAKSYVYKDSVSTLATNWNPHTYQTSDDAYPADFIRTGLYGFVFNDELHPSKVEGMEEYKGYSIIPEMAADFPEDITKEMKAKDNNKYGIPESAEKGYAYKIKLNEKACWEDGTPIKAEDYVYSLKQLLNPDLDNYRATDYYSGDLSIAGAEGYSQQGEIKWTFNAIGKTVEEYVNGGGKVEDLILDMSGFWGVSSADNKNYESVTDDRKVRDPAVKEGDDEDYVTAKYLYENYLAPGKPYAANAGEYLGTGEKGVYPEMKWEDVGIIANGDYEITLIFSKSLTDFYLLYNLTGNWLVKQDLYEANLKQDANGVWSSSYNTSKETTLSYGPYKMSEYKTDSSMSFVRNDKWYGYTDGQHQYVDPNDGCIYDMYQTTEITAKLVAEATTRKEMFLKGQLMGYGLQAEDFEQYRSSDSTYFSPNETIYFFIMNGHAEAIKQREANEGFDKTKYDLETLTLQSFRKAIAVTYDKEALCTAVSPARSGGYGIIGNNYIYNPETGAKYRDTDQAKQALCDFYSVDTKKFSSLDDAVKSITGYDPTAAKELFGQAYKEALEKGFITSADGKTSDQMIRIEYASSQTSDFIQKTIKYLNEKLAEVLKGTPFEGKVEIYESAPLGNEWSNNIKNGISDIVLGGWSGSALNPYGLTDLYTNPAYQYDGKWFNSNDVSLTIKVNGSDITLSLKEWSDSLNGTVVKKDDKEYNFGYGFADVDTRLEILSKIEGTILMTYDYIPMLQNASAALLSQQVFYVVEDYSAVMGRGGMTYMKYNYDETEWNDYVKQQGGTLKY